MSRNAQSYPEAGIIFIFNEATEYLVKSYSRCKREREMKFKLRSERKACALHQCIQFHL